MAEKIPQLLKIPALRTAAIQAIASYDGDAGWDLSEFILDEYLSYDALEYSIRFKNYRKILFW